MLVFFGDQIEINMSISIKVTFCNAHAQYAMFFSTYRAVLIMQFFLKMFLI